MVVDWFALLKLGAQRVAAHVPLGASLKTSNYEIRAPSAAGVITILRTQHELLTVLPLPELAINDSVVSTVQAEEPMTVKG